MDEIRKLEVQRDGLKKEVANIKEEVRVLQEEDKGKRIEIENLENVFKTLDSNIVTFQDLVNRNEEMRKMLDEMKIEFDGKKKEIELSRSLLELLRGSMYSDRDDLKRVCESIRDQSSDVIHFSNDLRRKAMEALVTLTYDSVIVLATQDKQGIKATFVNREEYDAEKSRWNDIERRNKDLKSSIDQLSRDCIGTVESVMGARSNDQIAKEFVQFVVRGIIERRIEDAYRNLAIERTISSTQKAVISIVSAIRGKMTEELEREKFVKVVYVSSDGNTGGDTLYFERILDALRNNRDVEGSSFVYNLCDVLRAIMIHYADGKDIPLLPLRKRGEPNIVRRSPLIRRDIKNPDYK
jgi:hypothetical protein